MWHVSTAAHQLPLGRDLLERHAVRVLDGYGDPAAGEWREWTGAAFHIRRRLTAAEAQRVGPVLDVRRTDEARRRAAALGWLLDLVPADVLDDELGAVGGAG